MNVWMKVCRKQAKCKYCPEPILNGEYMVVCKYYKNTKNSEGVSQKWHFIFHFHPQCWIDQAIAALKARVIVETRGRKKIGMTDTVRGARLKIMMRRASVTQRIKKEVSMSPDEQNIDRIIHLGSLLNKLREEIEPYGGVPESWT